MCAPEIRQLPQPMAHELRWAGAAVPLRSPRAHLGGPHHQPLQNEGLILLCFRLSRSGDITSCHEGGLLTSFWKLQF